MFHQKKEKEEEEKVKLYHMKSTFCGLHSFIISRIPPEKMSCEYNWYRTKLNGRFSEL
jgi:hypothetical protein